MNIPVACNEPAFDAYAENYDDALEKGLAITGEDKHYFAQGRVNWLAKRLRDLSFHPKYILDFGCGTGSGTSFLLQLPHALRLTGLDVSAKTITVARRLHASSQAQFQLRDEFQPRKDVDLAFCNGVFHHISPEERKDAIEFIYRSVRPGGLFAMWENNPWNPATRYVMHRIPFDRDAKPLSVRESGELFINAGFEIIHRDFVFFFPHWLRWFRGLESSLSSIPLGGQYEIIGRKRA
jgi:SAM-dependent methyltransferase